MTKEEIISILDFISEQGKADGCNGCKYISKDEYEEPCLRCKRNCKDYWRAGEHNEKL